MSWNLSQISREIISRGANHGSWLKAIFFVGLYAAPLQLSLTRLLLNANIAEI